MLKKIFNKIFNLPVLIVCAILVPGFMVLLYFIDEDKLKALQVHTTMLLKAFRGEVLPVYFDIHSMTNEEVEDLAGTIKRLAKKSEDVQED